MPVRQLKNINLQIRAVKRKGNVIARVIQNVRADTLTAFVREAVSHKVSLLCTDQWVGYNKLGKEFPHGVIDHSQTSSPHS
jgi:IS1 family transposase